MTEWQEAVRAAVPVAREAWREQGLPGPHMVRTDCALSVPGGWLLVHGNNVGDVEREDVPDVLDAPHVLAPGDGGPAVVLPWHLVDLSAGVPVGNFPAWLID